MGGGASKNNPVVQRKPKMVGKTVMDEDSTDHHKEWRERAALKNRMKDNR